MTAGCLLFLLTMAVPPRAVAPPPPPAAQAKPVLVTKPAPVTKPDIVAKPAHKAQTPRRFGQVNVVAIGGTTRFRLEQSYGTPNQFMFEIQPEVGFFVIRHLLVGGVLQLRYVHALQTAQTTFGMGPFAAYQFNIADDWDFLPTASLLFGFQHVHSEMGGATVANQGSFDLRAKFLWTVAAPFQMSIAPYFSHTLYTRGPQNGSYGVALGFQGWL